VVQQRIQVPGPSAEPKRVEDWVAMLELLAMRLAQGRIDKRDLPALVPAINRLIDVTDRRLRERDTPRTSGRQLLAGSGLPRACRSEPPLPGR